ncbi:MAG TPA: response regulator [Bacteroidota bacterium]|nr:response regulator [Bacteroidota bacterium]
MNNKPVILAIDDEIQIRRLLEMTLDAAGYTLRFATTGNDGIRMAASERPDLIVLDLGLPDIDGMDVLKKIREWATIPILVLSVRSSEADIVGCLDAGADDYLVKPFRTNELLARVRAALRHRSVLPEKELFTISNLTVDLSARLVKKKHEQIKLTATEYALLALFVKNAGRVLTHRFILEQVWGPTHTEEAEYTRIYVAQLRKKIEDNPSNPKIIITESGIGYRMVGEE